MRSSKQKKALTRWVIRIVLGEGHLCLEVAAIVIGVLIGDDQRDGPVEYVTLVRLSVVSVMVGRWEAEEQHTSILTHSSVDKVLYSFIKIRSAIVQGSKE